MSNLSSSEALINQILQDPILQWQLGDRVYQLLKEEIRDQRDRSHFSRG